MVIFCKDCFQERRAKGEPDYAPCKAKDTVDKGAFARPDCDQCGDPAEYQVVFFSNGEWH